MNLWLFKQEPDDFSYADLEAAGKTLWDGVANPLALKYLRQIVKGDKVYFYHTGKEKAVVGEMVVSAGPQKTQILMMKKRLWWKSLQANDLKIL